MAQRYILLSLVDGRVIAGKLTGVYLNNKGEEGGGPSATCFKRRRLMTKSTLMEDEQPSSNDTSLFPDQCVICAVCRALHLPQETPPSSSTLTQTEELLRVPSDVSTNSSRSLTSQPDAIPVLLFRSDSMATRERV